MAANNTTNDNKFYEYNDSRSIYQPSLFDNFTDEELDVEVIEIGESASIYEVDFEEMDLTDAELFLN